MIFKKSYVKIDDYQHYSSLTTWLHHVTTKCEVGSLWFPGQRESGFEKKFVCTYFGEVNIKCVSMHTFTSLQVLRFTQRQLNTN